jgi:hypothetical protein
VAAAAAVRDSSARTAALAAPHHHTCCRVSTSDPWAPPCPLPALAPGECLELGFAVSASGLTRRLVRVGAVVEAGGVLFGDAHDGAAGRQPVLFCSRSVNCAAEAIVFFQLAAGGDTVCGAGRIARAGRGCWWGRCGRPPPLSPRCWGPRSRGRPPAAGPSAAHAPLPPRGWHPGGWWPPWNHRRRRRRRLRRRRRNHCHCHCHCNHHSQCSRHHRRCRRCRRCRRAVRSLVAGSARWACPTTA